MIKRSELDVVQFGWSFQILNSLVSIIIPCHYLLDCSITFCPNLSFPTAQFPRSVPALPHQKVPNVDHGDRAF
jgi:hypothetical protein